MMMLDKQITHRFLDTLSRIEHGAITVTTPDGKVYAYAGAQPGVNADIIVHDWRAIPALAASGDIGFAEGYRDSWWSSSDLTNLFYLGLQNEAYLNRYIYGGVLARIASKLTYIFTQNTIRGSRKNIHAHYDLGNDFYKLWLDPTMTYSSALFKSEGEDLTLAQHRKYDRILERLGNSGNILEIGCGWGGFAERALESKDYAIKGLTISGAQHAYASERLKNKAHIALEDYRIQTGKFDAIVSIEMFEAVGEKYWPVYFGKLKSLLANGGKALIQTITIQDDYFDAYRKGGDAIRTFIFPGGMLPSPTRFEEESRKAGLRLTNHFAFGQNYAHTLERWLDQFEARLDDVRALGFDDKFIRMWRFYLTSCIASFRIGRTDVVQMELQHVA
jgi:cyclopropane-fatty-acyl-phospholipid synthase